MHYWSKAFLELLELSKQYSWFFEALVYKSWKTVTLNPSLTLITREALKCFVNYPHVHVALCMLKNNSISHTTNNSLEKLVQPWGTCFTLPSKLQILVTLIYAVETTIQKCSLVSEACSHYRPCPKTWFNTHNVLVVNFTDHTLFKAGYNYD